MLEFLIIVVLFFIVFAGWSVLTSVVAVGVKFIVVLVFIILVGAAYYWIKSQRK